MKGYCAAVRGCMNIPILYLLREHELPTNEWVPKDYDDSDERLMERQ